MERKKRKGKGKTEIGGLIWEAEKWGVSVGSDVNKSWSHHTFFCFVRYRESCTIKLKMRTCNASKTTHADSKRSFGAKTDHANRCSLNTTQPTLTPRDARLRRKRRFHQTTSEAPSVVRIGVGEREG